MKQLLLLLSLLVTSPAFATSWCDELWFTRNLLMDRAGYCFGSTLGQTYFNNADCVGKSVAPTGAGADLVERIRTMEADSDCKGRVSTSGTFLDVGDIGIRMMLTDLPTADEYPSACVGWRGPPTVLHAGKQAMPWTFGLIEPGDTISLDHRPESGWVYVTANEFHIDSGPWVLKSGGWIPVELLNSTECDSYLP